MILRKSVKYPTLTNDDLHKTLKAAGAHVCSSTVRRRLLEVGRRARKPIKKQLLTDKIKKKRLAWARKYKHWTKKQWRYVMFSDESHFEVQCQRPQYVRRSAVEPVRVGHVVQHVRHPGKVMFWGSFVYSGPINLVPVTGVMNSEKYVETIKTTVAPDLIKASRMAVVCSSKTYHPVMHPKSRRQPSQTAT